MSNEPDRYDKLAETLFSGAMYPSPGQVAAALRQAALDALERLAEELAINKNGNIQAGPARRTHVGLIHGIEIAEAVVHRHVLAASRALASPAAAPAAENTGMDFQPASEQDSQKISADAQVEGARPAGCQTPLRGTASGLSPSLLPRVLAALETEANAYRHRSFPTLANQLEALAAELRRYIAGVEAGHAEAPDAERDRNRHNAMLVEAWRGEFGTLCKVLFPGNDGPIGWKHVQAKVAALAARTAARSEGET